MANHGKQRTTRQMARHYAKPSRLARHSKRYDARKQEMEADLAVFAMVNEGKAEMEADLAARAQRVA
jgi:hypothetical protein